MMVEAWLVPAMIAAVVSLAGRGPVWVRRLVPAIGLAMAVSAAYMSLEGWPGAPPTKVTGWAPWLAALAAVSAPFGRGCPRTTAALAVVMTMVTAVATLGALADPTDIPLSLGSAIGVGLILVVIGWCAAVRGAQRDPGAPYLTLIVCQLIAFAVAMLLTAGGALVAEIALVAALSLASAGAAQRVFGAAEHRAALAPVGLTVFASLWLIAQGFSIEPLGWWAVLLMLPPVLHAAVAPFTKKQTFSGRALALSVALTPLLILLAYAWGVSQTMSPSGY